MKSKSWGQKVHQQMQQGSKTRTPMWTPQTPLGPFSKTTIIVTIIIIWIICVDLIRVAIRSKTVKANNVSKKDCDALEVLAQVLIGGDDNDYECDVVDDPGHHHHFDLFLLLSPSSTWSSSPPPGGQSHEKPSPSETSPCQAQSPRNKLHLEIG